MRPSQELQLAKIQRTTYCGIQSHLIHLQQETLHLRLMEVEGERFLEPEGVDLSCETMSSVYGIDFSMKS